jgi:hypothetical protein
LSARARVFATGQGRKTDATDAHSVALVGTRMAGLRPVVNDEQLAVLHIMARTQIRNPSAGRAYYERKKADGKAPMEAMRCVKRRLSDIVYRQMLDDSSSTRRRPGRATGKRL